MVSQFNHKRKKPALAKCQRQPVNQLILQFSCHNMNFFLRNYIRIQRLSWKRLKKKFEEEMNKQTDQHGKCKLVFRLYFHGSTVNVHIYSFLMYLLFLIISILFEWWVSLSSLLWVKKIEEHRVNRTSYPCNDQLLSSIDDLVVQNSTINWSIIAEAKEILQSFVHKFMSNLSQLMALHLPSFYYIGSWIYEQWGHCFIQKEGFILTKLQIFSTSTRNTNHTLSQSICKKEKRNCWRLR